jgi:hypothetical protein
MSSMSNVERLKEAGLLNPDALSSEQKHFINHKLTTEDIDDLIRVVQKLGPHARAITSPF